MNYILKESGFTYELIYEFLKLTEKDFTIPISKKTDIKEYAKKLVERGTLLAYMEGDKMCSFVGGYTDNTVNGLGYISAVATIKEKRGEGLAPKLIKRFLAISASKGLKAVHLYTDSKNISAIIMHEKNGFVDYHIADEPIPNDKHYIFYLDNL